MNERLKGQAGFVVSTEMMLIALVLVAGLVTGWVKLRDQSLAEIKDTMAAIDAYILGSGPLWQTGGTRWIKQNAGGGYIAEPEVPAISELWDGDPWLTVEDPDPPDNVFKSKDGVLIYGAPAAEAP